LSVLSRILMASLALAASAGAQDNGGKDLRVAAASDLATAIDRLASAFQKQAGIHVTVSLGSSGNFFAQIQNGAPFDVFLSADKSYPEKLEQAGKTEGTLVPYARGRLVLWMPNSSSLELPSKGQVVEGNLDALNGPTVRKIAIANPKHAPYGRAAAAALTHFGVYDQLKPKLVLGENISQTAQFVQSGNADVAFLSLSLAASGTMQREGHWLLLPDGSYPPIEQAGVVVKASQNKLQARRLLEFLVSPEGQTILRDFGFGAPTR
jgi:molybdate transport system substrate-binding protein